MAFKGTTRRTARQIAEEIEAVGGDLNAATSIETTAYYARVLKADVPLALDVLSDILSDPAFDPEELQREQNVIVQEIGAAEDTPGRSRSSTICRPPRFPDQPVGRSILGTPATVRSFDRAADLRAYLTRNYRGPDMVVAAAGAVDHRAIVARGRAAVRELHRSRRRRRRSRPGSAAARISRRAISSRCMSRSPWRAAAARSDALQPAGLHQRARRRHVVAAVPGGAREARPLLLDLCLPRALFGHRHVRPLCRHRRRRSAPS